MKEFTTENGTTLFYKVTYDLGGYNYFTYKNDPRCYRLYIYRNPREFISFLGLNGDYGAARVKLFEVGKASKKQRAKAESIALDKLKEFLNKYYSNL